MEILTVSQLTQQVKTLLEDSFGRVSVQGEISNLRQQSSGHIYFTLKDAGAQLSVVMFRSDMLRLRFAPADGMAVVVRGEMTVYPPRGNYQLRATSLQPQGKGTLHEQFEKLKQKLSLEGLFDQKRPLPIFPEKIALITSPTGAVIQDFLQIISRRCPRLNIRVYGVKVQGAEASYEIVDALQQVNREEWADVVVLARGGGSLEDLWCFNEERVVRAVVSSTIPTISAVGHETDFTLCDFAADLRAPTPSAAAELVSQPDEAWRELLSRYESSLRQEVLSSLQTKKQSLQLLAQSYVFREPRKLIDQYFQRLDELEHRLSQNLKHRLNGLTQTLLNAKARWKNIHPKKLLVVKLERLKHLRQRLELLSPQRTLERGYVLVKDKESNVISKAGKAHDTKELMLQFADGVVEVKPLHPPTS